MKILTTRHFVDSARAAPEPLERGLQQELRGGGVPAAVGDALARQLPGGHIVGLTRGRGLLKLWYYLSAEEQEPFEDPPLASLPRSELRALGLGRQAIGRVQAARSLAELQRLGLKQALLERLQFLFLQASDGSGRCADDDALLVRRAMDRTHLADLLRGRITDLLLNLDESQQRVVELSGRGTIVVQGVAGSGKTAVLLHRVWTLMSRATLLEPRTILLLTFNRSLANAARELLGCLGGRELREVEVQTLHRWCLSHAGVRARQVMSSEQRRRLLADAVRARRGESRTAALWGYPLSFWEQELHLIKGRVVDGAGEYMRLRRFGAQRPLTPRPRRLVWQVYEHFSHAAQQQHLLDWDDVVRLAHDKLLRAGDNAPRYDHVFVDEAQDLTAMGIRVAALLARAPGELFVGYDPAQSIYERGFRWKDAGVIVHGRRSFTFRRNYRNTRQILAAARPVLAAVQREQADRAGGATDQAELLEPEDAARNGPAPRHLHAAAGQEVEAMATEIRRLLQRRAVRPGNIAVLCFPNRVKQAIYRGLRQRDILCQMHHRDSEIRLADPSVKVLPMKSSKGLEFPVVLVVAAGRCFGQPRRDMDEVDAADWTAEMRRLFYVAMTRAMSELILVYPQNDPPPFL